MLLYIVWFIWNLMVKFLYWNFVIWILRRNLLFMIFCIFFGVGISFWKLGFMIFKFLMFVSVCGEFVVMNFVFVWLYFNCNCFFLFFLIFFVMKWYGIRSFRKVFFKIVNKDFVFCFLLGVYMKKVLMGCINRRLMLDR